MSRIGPLANIYEAAIKRHRLALGAFWLFTIFVLIALGSEDGAEGMMKTIGSLFGAAGVEGRNSLQFWRNMPLIYFGFALWVQYLYHRRLNLRGLLMNEAGEAAVWLGYDCHDFAGRPAWLCVPREGETRSSEPEKWPREIRYAANVALYIRLIPLLFPIAVEIRLQMAACFEHKLGEYQQTLRQAIVWSDFGKFHIPIALLAFGAGIFLWYKDLCSVHDWINHKTASKSTSDANDMPEENDNTSSDGQ